MIEDWFVDFLKAHRARHPHFPLPELDTQDGQILYEAWISAFRHRGLNDLAVATGASERLVGETIRFPREHLPKLIDLAMQIYAERRPADAKNPGSERAEVERLSRDCEGCGGGGVVSVKHLARSAEKGYPVFVAALCPRRCPYATWMEKIHREKHPETWRRLQAGRAAAAAPVQEQF